MLKVNRKSRPGSKPKRVLPAMLAVAVAAVAFTAAPASAGHDDRGRRGDYRSDRGRHYDRGWDRGRDYDRGHVHGRVVIERHVAPACRYIPARYETRTRQVLVCEGHYDKVWHEPEFGFRYDSHGHRVRFTISPGHYDSVWHPAEYRTESYQVCVPARWVCAPGCNGHHHH